MATIEIPDELYDAVAERARRNRRTIEEQASLELTADVEGEHRQRRRAIIEKLRHSAPLLPPDAPSPEEVIREIRDHDGRP
jgi:hypothetical protein